MEYTLFLFFSILLISASLCVIFIQDSVQAVFFLIFAFCNAVGLLFLIEAEFIGLLFLVVYVGAIAVLFLFVIIILNLKAEISFKFQTKNLYVDYYPISIFLVIFFFTNFYFLKKSLLTFKVESFLEEPNYLEWVYQVDNIQSLTIFGQTLYTFYFYYLLISGFVLLVSIIGAIALTSQKNQQLNFDKKQHVSSQLARDSIAAVYLVKQKNGI